MKVTTEACLFGAWVNSYIIKNNIRLSNILDIGTGTGLLSLLLCQQNNIPIHAIEIDPMAYLQATQNCIHNNKQHQITVQETSLQTFATNNTTLYDVIICNPPFYENQLKSKQENRNKALHDATLTFSVLFFNTKKLLSKQGIFFCAYSIL